MHRFVILFHILWGFCTSEKDALLSSQRWIESNRQDSCVAKLLPRVLPRMQLHLKNCWDCWRCLHPPEPRGRRCSHSRACSMHLSNWHHHLVTTSGTKAEASSLERKTAMPMKKWKHMICYFSPHRSREKRAPPWTHNAWQYPRPPPLAHIARRGVEPSFVHPSTPC